MVERASALGILLGDRSDNNMVVVVDDDADEACFDRGSKFWPSKANAYDCPCSLIRLSQEMPFLFDNTIRVLYSGFGIVH